MSPTQQQIQMAARMYQARDTVKRLAPAVYPERIKTWQAMIRKQMGLTRTDVLPAALALCGMLTEDPIGQMWILAAAIELIEPSEEVTDELYAAYVAGQTASRQRLLDVSATAASIATINAHVQPLSRVDFSTYWEACTIEHRQQQIAEWRGEPQPASELAEFVTNQVPKGKKAV